jgi:hypothetical protein
MVTRFVFGVEVVRNCPATLISQNLPIPDVFWKSGHLSY